MTRIPNAHVDARGLVQTVAYRPGADHVSDATARPREANDNAAGQVATDPALPAFESFEIRTIGDQPLVHPGYLVKGLLPENGVALLAGQYASAKTFVGLDLFMSIIFGQNSCSRRTKSGAGLWVAAEGAGEIEIRVEAARRGKYDDDSEGEIPFFWRSAPDVSKQDANAAQRAMFDWLNKAISATIKHSKTKFGVPLRVVGIDTMAAAFCTDDENDNAEAAKIMRALGDIGNKHGVLILVLTHLGKNAESGVRGASAYGAGADAILSLTTDSNGTTGEVSRRQMSLLKTRRGPTGPLSVFKLTPVEIGRDEDGEAVTFCFVTFDTTMPVGGPGRLSLSRGAMIFNDAFNEAVASNGREHRVRGDGPPVKAVPVNAVREEFRKRYLTGESDLKKKDTAARQAWRRALKEVTGLKLYAGENLAFGRGEELIWRVREPACDM